MDTKAQTKILRLSRRLWSFLSCSRLTFFYFIYFVGFFFASRSDKASYLHLPIIPCTPYVSGHLNHGTQFFYFRSVPGLGSACGFFILFVSVNSGRFNPGWVSFTKGGGQPVIPIDS